VSCNFCIFVQFQLWPAAQVINFYLVPLQHRYCMMLVNTVVNYILIQDIQNDLMHIFFYYHMQPKEMGHYYSFGVIVVSISFSKLTDSEGLMDRK